MKVQFLSKFIDFHFVLKCLFVFAGLYYFNIFYLGLTSPDGKIYNSFLEENLNYISWFTSSILITADFFVSFLGVEAFIDGPQTLKSINGAYVVVWLPCLGLGVSSFWIAFIIAHKIDLKTKILWCLIGVIIIWFINCWRIALFLLSLEKGWYRNVFVDHHTVFNVFAYIVIGLLIFSFIKKTKSLERTLPEMSLVNE